MNADFSSKITTKSGAEGRELRFHVLLREQCEATAAPSLDQSSMSEAQRLNMGTLSESVILPKSHL